MLKERVPVSNAGVLIFSGGIRLAVKVDNAEGPIIWSKIFYKLLK